MEFDKKSKLQLGGYPTRLQLYKTPPNETVSLKEFEELAELRLKSEPSDLCYAIHCGIHGTTSTVPYASLQCFKSWITFDNRCLTMGNTRETRITSGRLEMVHSRSCL